MKNLTRKLAAASAVLALGTGTAAASIIGPASAGGSELILSLVNNTTNDSISIDLGKTMSQIAVGDSFSLSPEAQNFITAAGGLGEVSYGVIAGDTSDFNTNMYVTSSTSDLTSVAIANATKGTWGNSIIELTGNLNASDATGPGVNNTYGPFSNALTSPNYTNGGHDVWQTGDPLLSNLALGNEAQNLYKYTLSGFVGTQSAELLLGAPLQLSENSLSVVPIPAAVWLFGSALLGMFGAGRREKLGAAFASLRERLSLRSVDLMA